MRTFELLGWLLLGLGDGLNVLPLFQRAPGLQLRLRLWLRLREYTRDRDKDRDLLESLPLRRGVSRSNDGLWLLLFAVRGDTERCNESCGEAERERPRGMGNGMNRSNFVEWTSMEC